MTRHLVRYKVLKVYEIIFLDRCLYIVGRQRGYRLFSPGWQVVATSVLNQLEHKSDLRMPTSTCFVTCLLQKYGGTRM